MSYSINDKRAADNKSRLACCGCFSIVFVVLLIFVMIIGITAGSGKIYEGSVSDLTSEQVKERDDFHVEFLSEYGVVLDSENRNSNDLNDVIDKVLASDKSKFDKSEAIIYYGSFMSAYYVEEDQSVISEYANLIKKDIEDGSFFEKISDDRYLMERAFMGRVVDASIPIDESNENLYTLDGLMADHYQYIKAYIRDDKQKMDSNWDQLTRDVKEVEVPVIDED